MSQLYQQGTTIAGHYTVTGVLGSGGMANVYLARDTEMNRTVAIKVYGADAPVGTPRSFMTEARAAAVLSHPNIVSVYDVLDMAGEKYIIMEYICGITLRRYLDHHGHLSVKECVNCADQVLRALHAAHSRGVIHRDIKPGNILITTEGRVKITDFGIARLPDRDSFLMPDRTVGTVHYISPEQAGGGSVDERSDLYSLGIVMYEMLTGRRPFEAKNPADVAMMQVSTRPEPPSYRNPAVPSALEKIVLCALEKDPSARFDSAAEMLRMLHRLSDDLLSGRARPLREEGSAYRMAVERPDDRTMPLPKSWLQREGHAVPHAPAAPAPTPTPTPVPPVATPAPRAEAPVAPPPPVRPATPPPVQTEMSAPRPARDVFSAFTAEDTEDIMLSSVGAVPVTPAPRAEAPVAPPPPPVRPATPPAPKAEAPTPPPAPVAEEPTEPPAAPAAEPEAEKVAEPKPKKPSRGHIGAFLAGESKLFSVFMVLAALILTVILVVGIITDRREKAEAEANPPEATASFLTEDDYAV